MNRILTARSHFSSKAASSIKKRIAVGTNKLSSPQPDGTFPSVVATAIQNNIDTFETTLDKEEDMRRGMTDAVMFLDARQSGGGNVLQDRSLKVVGKISYRTTTSDLERFDGDVLQEKTKSQNSDDIDTKSTTSNEPAEDKNAAPKSESEGEDVETPSQIVYHNISPTYIRDTIRKSPLAEMYANVPSVDLIYCAHNPEAQGLELLQKDAPLEEVRGYVKENMTQAFIAMEELVGEQIIGSYGVCSNGLGLTSSHPMHLSWEDVLDASIQASKSVHGHDAGDSESRLNNLSTLQLPANLLETHGLKVANRVKQYLGSPDAKNDHGTNLPNIQIHSTRPLTCYPNRGTGTGHPFKLVDYLIPTVEDGSSKMWSHEMGKVPTFYTSVLNETMAHFDATHLLEIKEEEDRQWNVEERETVDGCKLLQSMIHDLDARMNAGQLRSFAAYEEDLFSKVVPLIHDTFEEWDGDSALMLQRFFQAHGTAVRYSIAKTTRELLKKGGDGVEKYEIPDDVTMQDFAIRFLLGQQCEGEYATGPLIDRVVVGCPRAEHVIEAVQAADKITV